MSNKFNKMLKKRTNSPRSGISGTTWLMWLLHFPGWVATFTTCY
jgi:hypothetical protein